MDSGSLDGSTKAVAVRCGLEPEPVPADSACLSRELWSQLLGNATVVKGSAENRIKRSVYFGAKTGTHA